MLCENCGNNEANIKYTQITNGVKKQMNLCEKCANELGINNISFDMPINFSNFLEDIFDDDESLFMPSIARNEKLICDKCKMSYEDFIKNGKFGCDECYTTFEDKIDNLLKNIHGVNRHVGRKAKMLNTNEIQEDSIKAEKQEIKENKTNEKDEKIKKLQNRLKQEIKEERYEDAAKTRDEIKKLSNKIQRKN